MVHYNRLGKLKHSSKLLIDNHKNDSENSTTLLGIKIDNKLNFEKHVKALCQKAGCYIPVTIVLLCGISALLLCHRKQRKYRNVNRGYCIIIATPITTAYH